MTGYLHLSQRKADADSQVVVYFDLNSLLLSWLLSLSGRYQAELRVTQNQPSQGPRPFHDLLIFCQTSQQA